MRQTIRFEPNQPVTVALEYPEGIAVTGRSGPQVRYYLTDNRVMYLDPEPARALTTFQVNPGELFTITKRVDSGKSPWWDFSRVRAAGAVRGSGAVDSPTPVPTIESSPVSASKPVLSAGDVRKIPPQTALPEPPPPRGLTLSKTPPVKPTYEDALRYCVEAVQRVLVETGEQWSDQSRQAMVSTMMIQIGREGMMRFPAQQIREGKVA